MVRKEEIRDYGLVAYLMIGGYTCYAQANGSYCAVIDDDKFAHEVDIYRKKYKPILDKIRRVKKEISRPHAV